MLLGRVRLGVGAGIAGLSLSLTLVVFSLSGTWILLLSRFWLLLTGDSGQRRGAAAPKQNLSATGSLAPPHDDLVVVDLESLHLRELPHRRLLPRDVIDAAGLFIDEVMVRVGVRV